MPTCFALLKIPTVRTHSASSIRLHKQRKLSKVANVSCHHFDAKGGQSPEMEQMTSPRFISTFGLKYFKASQTYSLLYPRVNTMKAHITSLQEVSTVSLFTYSLQAYHNPFLSVVLGQLIHAAILRLNKVQESNCTYKYDLNELLMFVYFSFIYFPRISLFYSLHHILTDYLFPKQMSLGLHTDYVASLNLPSSGQKLSELDTRRIKYVHLLNDRLVAQIIIDILQSLNPCHWRRGSLDAKPARSRMRKAWLREFAFATTIFDFSCSYTAASMQLRLGVGYIHVHNWMVASLQPLRFNRHVVYCHPPNTANVFHFLISITENRLSAFGSLSITTLNVSLRKPQKWIAAFQACPFPLKENYFQYNNREISILEGRSLHKDPSYSHHKSTGSSTRPGDALDISQITYAFLGQATVRNKRTFILRLDHNHTSRGLSSFSGTSNPSAIVRGHTPGLNEGQYPCYYGPPSHVLASYAEKAFTHQNFLLPLIRLRGPTMRLLYDVPWDRIDLPDILFDYDRSANAPIHLASYLPTSRNLARLHRDSSAYEKQNIFAEWTQIPYN
ncbi:uncharacterized protein BDR25DRAFT_351831 [Lindgomyces ingoldianus]|uniref:Uncharacterized protein n=1 Tax=Lindgomyces ingoldianus TaxID=673940 RepID=A0ACB6R4L7_9PLEO|nr:uncharacterized protein BDR25DRAFT_351831 [Lindgomyces ingoldianus]KAF2474274.1 hypothetical protein BDR25DRAFT_351831 [Lindgomyces ingoldianus]